MTPIQGHDVQAPQRIERHWRWDNALAFLVVPAALGALTHLGDPHPGTEPLVLFVALIPVAWALVATALTVLSPRLAMIFLPLEGERRVFSKMRMRISIVHPGGGFPAFFVRCRCTLDLGIQKGLGIVPQMVFRLGRGQSATLAWIVQIRHRGSARMGSVHLSRAFPGSLVTRIEWFSDGREWVVAPARYRMKAQALDLLSGRRQATGRPVITPTALEEFAGVREWRPGDSPRLISWPLTFRGAGPGHHLVVREFEDPGADDACIVVDPVVGPPGPAQDKLRWQFEKALSCTIGLVRLLAAQGYRIRVLTLSAPARRVDVRVGRGRFDVDALERALAQVRPLADPGPLGPLLMDATRSGSSCVIFVSLRLVAEEDRDRRLPVLSILPPLVPVLTEEVVGA